MLRGRAWLAATLALLAPAAPAAAQTFSISDPENVEVAPEAPPPDLAPGQTSTLFRGSWQLQLGLDTGHEDDCDDRSCEDVFDLRNRLDLRLQTDVTGTLRAVVEARFDHLVVGERPEGETFTGVNAERVKGHVETEVREAWLRWRPGALDITVGNQVVAWGVLDMASAQDAINPADYRRGLAPGTEPPRIPVFAARLEGRLGPLALDGVLVPFFEAHRMNLFGSDFSMMPRTGSPGGGPGGAMFQMMRAFIDESREDEFQPLLQATEVPSDLPGSATAGLRVGTSLAGVDLHAAYLYGWDRFPRFEEVSALESKATYSRMHVLGADATAVLGEVVVRAEAGWTPRRTLYLEGFEPVDKPTLLSGLGLDWSRDTTVNVSLEGFWFRVLDTGQDERLYLIDRDVFGVAGGGTVRLLDDDLALSVFGMYNVSLEDVIVAPQVAWRAADGHELAASFQLFEGPEGTVGGMFDSNDQVLLRYTGSF